MEPCVESDPALAPANPWKGGNQAKNSAVWRVAQWPTWGPCPQTDPCWDLSYPASPPAQKTNFSFPSSSLMTSYLTVPPDTFRADNTLTMTGTLDLLPAIARIFSFDPVPGIFLAPALCARLSKDYTGTKLYEIYRWVLMTTELCLSWWHAEQVWSEYQYTYNSFLLTTSVSWDWPGRVPTGSRWPSRYHWSDF